MSPSTAKVAIAAPPELSEGFRVGPEIFAHGAPSSDAQVLVEVATHLCVQGCAYERFGRGPHAFDDVGLVRTCIQAVFDWRNWQDGLPPHHAVADATGYGEGRCDIDMSAGLLTAWGLKRPSTARDQNISKLARPGDIIQYMGAGPNFGVVVAPWRETVKWPNFESPAVAYVWAGEGPRVSRDARMAWFPHTLWRFPEGGQ